MGLNEVKCAPVARHALALGSAASVLLLAGCAQMPSGPTVTVMPGPYKPFEVFVADDHLCRDWATSSIGGPGSDAASQRFAAATATGAVLGAAAGALVGGHNGAGVGAAFGGVTGAAVGSDQS
ncbi:MAG TPA: YMGG-like glycine zipper-containing protein, partial [Rhizobacter sp.]|nr:YMGG-like glycine zipper-containing protein [Rhizobacter sp.]